MIRTLLASLLLASGLAHAAEGRKFVTLDGPRDAAGDASDHTVPSPLPTDGPYTPEVYRASAALKLDRDFVAHVARGLELLYERRYGETRVFFRELEEVFPGTAASAVADVLVWQAAMMENFDYKYEGQYEAANQLARRQLTAALAEPGRESWEYLMLTVVSGIEAIHAAREGRYLAALRLAFEAIDRVESTRKAAPEFLDLQLADGLYNYWRTSITEKSRALPSFGDHRALGIQQMEAVVKDGAFLKAPARLALAFSFMDEDDHDRAHILLWANHEAYPDNVINEMMIGMNLLYGRKFDGALQAFERVLAIDPQARRVHYYKGLALQRSNQLDAAKAQFEHYLTLDHLVDYQTSYAWYRLGQVAWSQKRYADAAAAYEKAIAVDGNRSAKTSLDHMKKKRRAGEIDF